VKLNNSFIQSLAILVMLAELPQGTALKSQEISQRMDVSPTYLLKIAKKLKDAGLINSSASKNGGYTIKKDIRTISFLEVFEAVEENDTFLDKLDLNPIHNMFLSEKIVHEQELVVKNILLAAEAEYKQTLAQHFVDEIAPKDASGKTLEINWKQIISEK
jgi:Rrf2 family iron-sulfur cluster assembly transcriptional regulator